MKWWIKIAFVIDMLRLFPRAFCSLYLLGGYLILQVWIGGNTTWHQDGFAAIYAGLCIPMLKWYMENGTDYSQLYRIILRGYVPLRPPLAHDGRGEDHHDDDHHEAAPQPPCVPTDAQACP
jgi:hypothetical protein